MEISTKKLKELLVDPGHIKEEVFADCLTEAKKSKQDLLDIILDKELLSDEQLGSLIAQSFNVPFVALRKTSIDKKLFKKIPELMAAQKELIVFAQNEKEIKIAMRHPDDLASIHFLEKFFQKKLKIYYTSKQDINYIMNTYELSLKEEFGDILKLIENSNIRQEEKNKASSRIIELLLRNSYFAKASDIHIEPYYDKAIVRFRIDGVMTEVLDLPTSVYGVILARIKIMSRLRIDEHQSAQDGKFRFSVNNDKFDVRVSIVPVTSGENIVMRLLFARKREIDLPRLGIKPGDISSIKKAIKNPHGMILVVGPTGSGKSTTLYSLLRILNTRQVNISTIEDPVEYDVEGISQIQVNIKTNLTFANGLRAIVRQDPDIIMVGEIRDQETASIAVNSSMTGHLLLSTLHANDAATTLPRLLDMGIEPFLIASSLKLIISQRLVRKICEKCRASYELSREEIVTIKSNKFLYKVLKKKAGQELKRIMLFKGRGCKLCSNTGYRGRIGVFEVLKIDSIIKRLIIERASSGKIKEAALAGGMDSMLDDGLEKALGGATSLSEILRVADLPS